MILPALGGMRCDAITLPAISRFINSMDTDRKGRLVRVVLGTLFNHGRLTGAVTHNPLAGVRFPRSYRPTRVRYTAAHVESVCQGLDPDLALFVRFLAETGLRPWKEGHLLTRSDIGRVNDEWYVRVPASKTRAGEGRVVPISDPRILDVLLDREDRLFPLSASTYKRRLSGSGLLLQALRRLAITRWCERGESLDVVRARAGHSDLRLTLDVYNEVTSMRAVSGVEGVKSGVRVSDLLGD